MSLECVIVGHNEGDFERRALGARELELRSGLYEDIKMNSVLIDGKRINYMTLLNRAIAAGAGTDPRLSVFRAPHLGACYLTSFLTRLGIETALVNSYRDDHERFRELLRERPRAVAITTTYYVDDAPIREIVDFVRAESPDTRIIIGGPHMYSTSVDYDARTQQYVLDSIGGDIYINDSQGETTLGRLLLALRDGDGAIDRLPNLAIKAGRSGWKVTARQVENNALDDNTVQWSLFDPTVLGRMVAVRTARSCPFACSFCNYPTMAGQHVLLSTEVLERELRQLHEAGVRWINFVDDTFNVPLPRFKALLRMMIKNRFEFEWVSFLRCSNTDDETFELMRESGCVAVFLGIESADAATLVNMNKKATPDRYRYGIARLHKVGIASFASLIVGFPGETADSVRTTIDFIEETRPTFFNAQLYYHDLQSPIHRRAADFGIKGAGYSWSQKTMTWQDAAQWTQTMFRDVSGSTPVTVDGMSVWAFAYLMQHGIDIPLIRRFSAAARPLLVDGLDERPVETSGASYQNLLSIFAEEDVRRRLVHHHAGAVM